jgi:hypothetical protein
VYRTQYYNYIEEKLSSLAYRIEIRAKINLLELNIHSETFFVDLLNVVYKYSLTNQNAKKQNTESIDLIDIKNKLVAQVSSTCSKQKIETTLSKKILAEYNDFTFKFISISKNADDMRKMSFANPHGVNFNPEEDIIDIASILRYVASVSIDKQNAIYMFIKKELGNVDLERNVASNLTAIINILACEDLTDVPDYNDHDAFVIDNKIIFNNLVDVRDILDEYKIYCVKLNELYAEFDKQGKNRSLSVLNKMKSVYTKLSRKPIEPRELFFTIIDAIANDVINSNNYVEIPIEELEMCIHILVVDAFIRCKIFKNPGKYSHVAT